MTDQEVFFHLFEIAKDAKDPEGVVTACLIKDGQIVMSSPSADDGIRHAEDLVLEMAKDQGIEINKDVILYTTLEPCSYRSPSNNVKDCTSIILGAGITNVVFGANDPEFSKEAKERFEKAGANYRQVDDRALIRKSTEIFNGTIKIPLTSMGLPREKKLPEDL